MAPPLVTVRDQLAWSYANLAMADAAIGRGDSKFGTLHYMIRSKLFKGLVTGTMKIGSLFKDEKLKLEMPKACCYCGAIERLSLDHLLPRHMEGADNADNLVWACRTCNSSKGSTDMLAWFLKKEVRPPLLLYRRYMKLAFQFCEQHQLMDALLADLPTLGIPFRLDLLITWFPDPLTWVLWVEPRQPPTPV